MNNLTAALLALPAVLAVAPAARAQLAAPDPRLAASIAAVQQPYTDTFVGISQLYNGPEYVDYKRWYYAHTGHQFFLSADKQSGSVHYNNYLFPNVQLTYDVVRDQLVLPQPTSPLTLSLINERVRGFTIGGHRFVRLVADSAAAKVIRTGYYEVLVDSSRAQVLAKRAKRMQEQIKERNVVVKFIGTDKLFIRKGGAYYAAGKKAAVLRVFADRGKEMQRFAQERQLSFKKDQLEATVVLLARYYNGLPLQ